MSIHILPKNNVEINQEIDGPNITGNVWGVFRGAFTISPLELFETIEVSKENGGLECCPREIYAKSSSPCTNVDTKLAPENSEKSIPISRIVPSNIVSLFLSSDDFIAKVRKERVERYRLLSIARLMFIAEGKKDKLRYAQNFHRTAKCMVTRFKENVEIRKDRKRNTAFFYGVVRCSSVWSCPVCAPKIQEQRRFEICQAMDWAYTQKDDFWGEPKYKCVMVTLTFVHYAFDTCRELLDKQAEALKYFRSGKAWDNFKKEIGFLALIRALEVLWGIDNGWHPHTHEIWIINADCDIEELKKFVLERWAKACKKVGLLPENRTKAFDEHAVCIERVDSSSYLAKQNRDLPKACWGADKELAMPNRKESKAGRSPFDLLNDYSNGDIVAGRLYIEYSIAFKGKRQLFWSNHLKELVGLPEITDEQAANKDDPADVLSFLSDEQWDIVVKKNAHAKILDVVEQEGLNGIKRWFAENGG